MQAKEPPHLTLVHTSTVKAMFDKEISAIGAVVSRKSSNPPLPLPPKRRVPTVSPAPCAAVWLNGLPTYILWCFYLFNICCCSQRNLLRLTLLTATYAGHLSVVSLHWLKWSQTNVICPCYNSFQILLSMLLNLLSVTDACMCANLISGITMTETEAVMHIRKCSCVL